jgi:hypothetical protein
MSAITLSTQCPTSLQITNTVTTVTQPRVLKSIITVTNGGSWSGTVTGSLFIVIVGGGGGGGGGAGSWAGYPTGGGGAGGSGGAVSLLLQYGNYNISCTAGTGGTGGAGGASGANGSPGTAGGASSCSIYDATTGVLIDQIYAYGGGGGGGGIAGSTGGTGGAGGTGGQVVVGVGPFLVQNYYSTTFNGGAGSSSGAGGTLTVSSFPTLNGNGQYVLLGRYTVGAGQTPTFYGLGGGGGNSTTTTGQPGGNGAPGAVFIAVFQ